MWGPCSPMITAKSILIKNATGRVTHKKCKDIDRKIMRGMRDRKQETEGTKTGMIT